MVRVPTELEEGKWPRWTKRVREVESQALADHIDEVVEEARTNFSCAFGVASQDCESPIEALFLAAFIGVCLRDSSYKIYPQRHVGRYRVDFYITFMADDPKWRRDVIVECDGHDYHERTKEQAERDKKRDRAITGSGIPVFRFTGRELHRDPEACVMEILDYTQEHLGRRPEGA